MIHTWDMNINHTGPIELGQLSKQL